MATVLVGDIGNMSVYANPNGRLFWETFPNDMVDWCGDITDATWVDFSEKVFAEAAPHAAKLRLLEKVRGLLPAWTRGEIVEPTDEEIEAARAL